jgi:hypothetical protein
MAKKTESQPDAQVLVRVLFPDERERTGLLQSALVRLHPEAPEGGQFAAPISVAEITLEMLRIRGMRKLVRLILALEPERMHCVERLLGDCGNGSLVETAHLFGVSESTVNDWELAGMPIGRARHA